MPAAKRLLIEIKTGPEVIPELRRVIESSGKERQMLLQSFSYPACVEARKAFPRIPVYLLIKSKRDLLTRTWLPTINEAIPEVKAAGLDGISVNASSLVHAAAIQKIHSAGLKVHVWTIDKVNDAKKLLAWEVDGLITNRPGWLKTQLALS